MRSIDYKLVVNEESGSSIEYEVSINYTINPGCPGNRMEPGETPFVEDVYVASIYEACYFPKDFKWGIPLEVDTLPAFWYKELVNRLTAVAEKDTQLYLKIWEQECDNGE